MNALPTACVIGAGSSGIAAAKALARRAASPSTATRSPTASAATGSSATPTACRPPTARCTSTRRASAWSTRTSRCRSPTPTSRTTPTSPSTSTTTSTTSASATASASRPASSTPPAATTACGRSRSTTARRTATTRCSSPTATTGTRAGPSPRSPARDFEGAQMHSHDYKATTRTSSATRPSSCSGWATGRWTSRSRRATSRSDTYLAARRGAHVIPKYCSASRSTRSAARRRSRSRSGAGSSRALLKARSATWSTTGCPSPTTSSARPTRPSPAASSTAWRTARSRAKPNIAELSGDRVRFADGTEVEADVVVYCTGYKVTFPFFDEGFIAAPDNDLPLFRRVFHPDIPTSSSSGCSSRSARSCRSPSASEVGRRLPAGDYALPAPAELRADIEARAARDVQALRRLQAPHDADRLRRLPRGARRKERKAGAERARAQGNRLPVPPRAAAPVAA